jgi:hypothetical protein
VGYDTLQVVSLHSTSRALLEVFALVAETVKRSLLEILRREEYSFEDSRSVADRDRIKVSEPESVEGEPRRPELVTEIQRTLLGGRHGDHPEVRDSVSGGVFALTVICDEGIHFAHEIGLLPLVVALAGADNLQEKVCSVLTLRFLAIFESEERIGIHRQASAPFSRRIEQHGPAL